VNPKLARTEREAAVMILICSNILNKLNNDNSVAGDAVELDWHIG